MYTPTPAPTPTQLDSLVRSIDENNNGEIDYEEFVTACINTHQWTQKETVIREAFNSFDLDGDGTIDIFELHEALRKSGNKQVKEISVEVERILNEVCVFGGWLFRGVRGGVDGRWHKHNYV